MRIGAVFENHQVFAECTQQEAARDVDPRGLLPQPQPNATLVVSGVAAHLAVMVLESGKEQRRAARYERDVSQRAQYAAEEAQLEALRERAFGKLLAGLTSGISQAASGALAMGGAHSALPAQADFRGSAEVVKGMGTLEAGIFDHGAELAAVTATRSEQAAARHKRAVDESDEDVREARKTIDKAIDFYREYAAARAEAARAALLKA